MKMNPRRPTTCRPPTVSPEREPNPQPSCSELWTTAPTALPPSRSILPEELEPSHGFSQPFQNFFFFSSKRPGHMMNVPLPARFFHAALFSGTFNEFSPLPAVLTTPLSANVFSFKTRGYFSAFSRQMFTLSPSEFFFFFLKRLRS